MSKRKIQSKRMRQKKKMKRNWIVALIIFLIIAFFVGISYASHHESMKIKHVEIKGNTLTTNDDFQNIIWKHLRKKQLLILSGKNSLHYSKKKMQQDLHNAFSEIQEVDIKVRDWHTLVVNIKEFESDWVWCREDSKKNNKDSNEIIILSEKCYFLNKEGMVFARVPENEEVRSIKVYGAIEGYPIEKFYVEKDFFEILTDFAQYVEEQDIEVSSVSTENSEIFTLHTTREMKIYISNQDDLETVAENFTIILYQEEGGIKEKLDDIEYVDLRFGNRVFYKEKVIEEDLLENSSEE